MKERSYLPHSKDGVIKGATEDQVIVAIVDPYQDEDSADELVVPESSLVDIYREKLSNHKRTFLGNYQIDDIDSQYSIQNFTTNRSDSIQSVKTENRHRCFDCDCSFSTKFALFQHSRRHVAIDRKQSIEDSTNFVLEIREAATNALTDSIKLQPNVLHFGTKANTKYYDLETARSAINSSLVPSQLKNPPAKKNDVSTKGRRVKQKTPRNRNSTVVDDISKVNDKPLQQTTPAKTSKRTPIKKSTLLTGKKKLAENSALVRKAFSSRNVPESDEQNCRKRVAKTRLDNLAAHNFHVCPTCNCVCCSKRDLTKHLKSHKIGKPKGIPVGNKLSGDRILQENSIKTEPLSLDEDSASEPLTKIEVVGESDSPLSDGLQDMISAAIRIKEEAGYSSDSKLQQKGEKKTCKICSKKVFRLERHLLSHQEPGKRIPENEEKYPCNICLKRFSNPQNRTQHYKIHLGLKAYVCPICNEKFRTNSNMKRHLLTHQKREKIPCKTCGVEFTSENNLKIHEQKHNGSGKFQCVYCPASFAYMSRLKVHSVVHTGIRDFKCDICSKSYKTKAHLMTHAATHRDVRVFNCYYCETTFNLKCNLRTHIEFKHLQSALKSKSGKPFSCKDCPRKFASKGRLQNHLNYHEKKHRFKCDACPAAFISNEKLKRHIAVVHNGSWTHACELCPSGFKTKGNLAKHMVKHFKTAEA